MKVVYFSKKQLTNCLFGILILLLTNYLLNANENGVLTVSAPLGEPIYQGNSEKKQVTFAINIDWGEEYLPVMLEIFRKNQIHVTFFPTGRWAEKFPELVMQIARDGHEIGNHGFSHASPNGMSLEQNKAEIRHSEEVIKEITGQITRLFAPASGERSDHVLKAAHELGYRTILWSIDTVDWKRPPADQILGKVLGKIHNGAIILMHPTKPTVEALPVLIKEIKEKGFELVPVSQNII